MFLLLDWGGSGTNKFSVVSEEKLVNGELRNNLKSLIGKQVKIQWTKSKQYTGRVLELGEEDALWKRSDELVEEMHESAENLRSDEPPLKKARKKKSTKRASEISSVLNSLDDNQPSTSTAACVPELPEKTEDSTKPPKDYKALYLKYKEKYRAKKAELDELRKEIQSDENIELAENSGIFMKRSDLSKMQMVSECPTVLARNLFRSLFTGEELATSSLLGKRCNANRSKEPLPEIDAVRRNAIFSYVLKLSGIDVTATGRQDKKKLRLAKREITKSLSDFLREERRKSSAS